MNNKLKVIFLLFCLGLLACNPPKNPPVFILNKKSGELTTKSKITRMNLLIEKGNPDSDSSFTKILDMWCEDSSGIDGFRINLLDLNQIKSKGYCHVNYSSDSIASVLQSNDKLKIQLYCSQFRLYNETVDPRTYLTDTIVDLSKVPGNGKIVLKYNTWH